MSFEAMCQQAVRLGAHGFDAVEASEWPTMRRFGLVPTLAYPEVTPPPFGEGIGRPELHERMEALLHGQIEQCARDGCGTIPVAGGQRARLSYEAGADNCVAFFNRIKAHAEAKRITVCIEVMNRYDRPDQFCDHVAWGVDVCRRVNSPRIKLLFDIYHAQIQDGVNRPGSLGGLVPREDGAHGSTEQVSRRVTRACGADGLRARA
jgi:hydroxypyruvate isomerase